MYNLRVRIRVHLFLYGDTTLNVKDVLADALKAVDDAGVPADLREIAFGRAIDLIAASRDLGPSISGITSSPAATAAPAVMATADPGAALLGKVAAKLCLDLAVIEDVYHEHDGSIDIVVPPGLLEGRKAPGMKQLALLTAAGRQAAELDDFTSMDTIREFARQYNRYDGANFASDLQTMADEFRYRRDGRKISVKLSRVGWERATELVGRLSGGAGA